MGYNVRIILQNSDGTREHARGEIADEIIYSAGLLKRDERYYIYGGMRNGTLTFRETTQPYNVTEF